MLSSDETFVNFYECIDLSLVPKGTKKVASALKINEKEGCTVMVTLDMLGNRVLPPLIVFSGNFGKTNMKRYRSVTKATILFTKTHWMTVHCLKLYFKYLSLYYPGKKIGLVYDSAPTHLHSELKEWLTLWNQDVNKPCEFYVEFIEPSLTSVYQPPDVFFNKPLKQSLRKKYNEYVSYLSSKGSIKPGDNVPISREVLIDFICTAFDEANLKYKVNKEISRSFERCGLNPFCDDDSIFQRHLNSLDENRLYESISSNQAPIVCGEIDAMIVKNNYLKP